MPERSAVKSIAAHFLGKGANVKATYAALLRSARTFGPVREEPKQTSILWCRETAFAGIATQREALILTLKLATDLKSPRIRKHQQASANRWHLEFRLDSPGDVDAELEGWLQAAYSLAG